ncbi:DUF5990 family protein [Spirosoma sp. KNUC1025]|uniref:DUF5990 family protein n=1 Tax=Spirosoma sp. KNUC1025 TaxID=2894082 RepID=UPI00387001A9|nr:DUF5990 family protein [Spirosoma sp. KNUC1025]
MFDEINLRILLENPVEGVLYGLQKGKGAHHEIVQAQMGNRQELTFRFVVQRKQTNESAPSLTGPFVQGTPGTRFVYINIGSYAGQAGALCNGRLKVPLTEADFQDTSSSGSGYGWSCTVPGRTENGTPVFATVKPFGEWTKAYL